LFKITYAWDTFEGTVFPDFWFSWLNGMFHLDRLQPLDLVANKTICMKAFASFQSHGKKSQESKKGYPAKLNKLHKFVVN
jgi:hypothetical protein